MKRALVLAGGGSKGSYEVGFIRALKEMNIDISIVTGTSIGALNGCLLAQHDEDALFDLWHNMDINTVIAGGFSDDFSFLEIDKMIDQSNLVASFFKNFIIEKGADITSLKKVIRDLLDEDKLLSSSIDFGLCTVQFPNLKPVMITKEEMAKEDIFDYLIASASCFPAFPIHTFHNQSYIDGGYFDNLPIDLAFSMGAQEVIVVDMKTNPIHPHYVNKPKVIYTTPYVDLGRFLDFSKDTLERNERLGYQCAKKTFGCLEGLRYSFYPFESTLFDSFYDRLLYLERHLRISSIKDDNAILTSKILEESHQVSLDLKDYVYVVIDWLGELSQIDSSYIYEFSSFVKQILQDYEKYMYSDYKFVDFSEDLFETLKQVNKKTMVGRMFHQLLFPNHKKVNQDRMLNLFPKESMMAELLFCLYYYQKR